MSSINDFEAELMKKLDNQEDAASVVRWISEKALELLVYSNVDDIAVAIGRSFERGTRGRREFPHESSTFRSRPATRRFCQSNNGWPNAFKLLSGGTDFTQQLLMPTSFIRTPPVQLLKN